MKKAIVAALSLIIFLSSCSKELIEHDEKAAGDKINFSAFLQRSNLKQVRYLNDLNALKYWGFTVNAYSTATTSWNDGGNNANTPLLTQQHVEFNFDGSGVDGTGGTWSYSPTVSWPSNSKVSFFAYAVVEGLNAAQFAIDDGDAVIHYETSSNVGGYTLLVSYLLDNTKVNRNSEGRLNFTMKHALSRVGFKAKYIASANISSVKISEFAIKTSADLQTSGTFKLTGANSLDAGTNNPWVDRQISGFVRMEGDEGHIEIGTSFGYVLPNPEVENNASRNFMLLIPQDITPGMITVSMKITASKADGSEEVWTITDRDLYPALKRRGITSLQMGKAYDFAFNFNVGNNSAPDPNDPTTPFDSQNVLNSVDVTETDG